MILLLNVKITDNRLSGPRFYRNYTAGHYDTNSRVDVFKYFLSSHSVLLPLISKCVFYIEMADDTIHRKDEVENYIKSLYPAEKLILNWYRNDYVTDWRNVCTNELSKIDDNIIWVAGNDDHIFIDNSIDVVKRGLDILQSDEDPMSFIYYSHWPEQMYVASQLNAELVDCKNYVKYRWNNFDSIMVLKKERFEKYWFDSESTNYQNEVLFKPDVLHFMRSAIIGNAYTPTKEIVRHFDGYGHVADFSNFAPSMVIPNGFFENNIKIKFGYENRYEEYTNINPASQELYAYSVSGTDYRWCLEDLPLFWKDKISEVDTNESFDANIGRANRNRYYVDCARFNGYQRTPYDVSYIGLQAPDAWFSNNLL
jgi:hypothetical protein